MRKKIFILITLYFICNSITAQPGGSIYYLDSIAQSNVLNNLKKEYLSSNDDTSGLRVLYVKFGFGKTKGCILFVRHNILVGHRILVKNNGVVIKKRLSPGKIRNSGIGVNYLSSYPFFSDMNLKLWCTGTSVNDDRYFILYKGNTILESAHYSIRCLMFNTAQASSEVDIKLNNLIDK